jgi:PiT family inorganic phosphate transporter
VVSLVFAAVSGANDGATLAGLATRTGALTPLAAVLLLAGLIALGPWAVGTSVARTVAQRLVGFEGSAGRLALLAAVLASLVVVFTLSRFGLPTSLTLALMGGIVGAGLGDGLRIAWAAVAQVLVIGLVAPVAAAAAGAAAVTALRRLPATVFRGRPGRDGQRLGFVAQCLAYSSNDAQKMVAMMAVATRLSPQQAGLRWPAQLAIAGCYAVGTVAGLRPVAWRVAEQMLAVRPSTAVALGFSASATVLTSTALGVPVSSTQAATMALVGCGFASNRHRIRWHEVRAVGGAWVCTLPASVCLGALLGAIAAGLR